MLICKKDKLFKIESIVKPPERKTIMLCKYNSVVTKHYLTYKKSEFNIFVCVYETHFNLSFI